MNWKQLRGVHSTCFHLRITTSDLKELTLFSVESHSKPIQCTLKILAQLETKLKQVWDGYDHFERKLVSQRFWTFSKLRRQNCKTPQLSSCENLHCCYIIYKRFQFQLIAQPGIASIIFKADWGHLTCKRCVMLLFHSELVCADYAEGGFSKGWIWWQMTKHMEHSNQDHLTFGSPSIHHASTTVTAP